MEKPIHRIQPGKTYGLIRVLESDDEINRGLKYWKCECLKCGSRFSSSGQWIVKIRYTGCTECRKKERDKQKEEEVRPYIGKLFGALRVVGFSGMQEKYGRRMPIMVCVCEKCGNKVEIPLARLKAGKASQCVDCARENLNIGQKIREASQVSGTMITAIDGNREINRNNSSGHTGVSWGNYAKKWRAYITFRRKQYNLGLYEKIEDAIKAREKAERAIYGDFLTWYAAEYPDEWKKVYQEPNMDYGKYTDLSALTYRQKEIFKMRQSGKTIAEIAEACGTKEGSVTFSLNRSVKILDQEYCKDAERKHHKER